MRKTNFFEYVYFMFKAKGKLIEIFCAKKMFHFCT